LSASAVGKIDPDAVADVAVLAGVAPAAVGEAQRLAIDRAVDIRRQLEAVDRGVVFDAESGLHACDRRIR
jgi:hypothetical protein